MRRSDRAVTDHVKIREIIHQCHCCRIGFCDDGQVYIVPLNFGYEYEENNLVFYFHSASEGRKIDIIRKNPTVGFELDTGYKLNEADVACGYSARFQSIIGNGTVCLITQGEEKEHALQCIMEHISGKDAWQFDEKMLHAVTVFKLTVSEISCKEHP